jgi:hypothetical protein
MDEGRKRVIGIMAALLTAIHMQRADDLFLEHPRQALAQTNSSRRVFNGPREDHGED